MVQKRKKPINVVLSQFRRQNAPAGGGNQSRDREGAELERQERKWSVAASERRRVGESEPSGSGNSNCPWSVERFVPRNREFKAGLLDAPISKVFNAIQQGSTK